MSLKESPNYIYAKCDHIKRVEPDFQVNEEIAKEIGSNYSTLPAFEQSLYDHVLRRHYSLERNEFLKCRWREYKKYVEGRAFAPFQFPEPRDLHFHNNTIRFLPSESVHKPSKKRGRRMKPGPGVDFGGFGGQMPIPQESMMKRGTVQEVAKPVKEKKLKKRTYRKS